MLPSPNKTTLPISIVLPPVHETRNPKFDYEFLLLSQEWRFVVTRLIRVPHTA